MSLRALRSLSLPLADPSGSPECYRRMERVPRIQDGNFTSAGASGLIYTSASRHLRWSQTRHLRDGSEKTESEEFSPSITSLSIDNT